MQCRNMLTIGAQRIHPSPFLASPSPQQQEQPRRRQQQMLAATYSQQQTPGGGRSQAAPGGGRGNKRGSGGGGRDGACPQRFERTREDRRSNRPPAHQQQRGAGEGSGPEPGNAGQRTESFATTNPAVTSGVPAVGTENGRGSRSSVAESAESRRQPQPPQRQLSKRYRNE